MAFIFYDVETTGLNRRFDQILQFAAVRTDVDLIETGRFETRSRLMPHVVPSPKALHVTGMSLDDANSMSRQSHYDMVCEIAGTLAAWCPATFLGFNSIRFDEEFLRQAFYQCLHPVFLTNTNGNARADVLNLMRAAATLHPSVIRPGVESDGRPSYRLGSLAAANGIVVGKVHDAAADVDAMLALCRIVRAGAPDLWSAFLRFSSKAAVVDLVRDEEAFAYFDFFDSPRVMHFLTRVGVSPNDANAHYCLDLTCDIDALRKLDAAALSERMKQEPRPIRRIKVNGSPLLYPLWDIDPERFGETSEDELTRTASSVRADQEFIAALTRAAALTEPVYAASEHVELQIYGGNFISDGDSDLCRQFHGLPWDADERSFVGSATSASSALRAGSSSRTTSRRGGAAREIMHRRLGRRLHKLCRNSRLSTATCRWRLREVSWSSNRPAAASGRIQLCFVDSIAFSSEVGVFVALLLFWPHERKLK